MATGNKSKAEVEQKFPTIPTAELGEIESFEQAVALAQATYGADVVVNAADVLGDGFKLLTNKSTLIGVGFFAVAWNFTMGDHGEFVAVKAITKDNQKLVITDGSKGIYEMLVNYSKQTGRYGGLFVPNGLRKSDYTYTDDKGDEKAATTFYLDVSA